MLAKIKWDDVPENAVFYLHDQSYQGLVSGFPEEKQVSVRFKIRLLKTILGVTCDESQGLLREIEECLMIAHGCSLPIHQTLVSHLKSRTTFLSVHCLE